MSRLCLSVYCSLHRTMFTGFNRCIPRNNEFLCRYMIEFLKGTWNREVCWIKCFMWLYCFSEVRLLSTFNIFNNCLETKRSNTPQKDPQGLLVFEQSHRRVEVKGINTHNKGSEGSIHNLLPLQIICRLNADSLLVFQVESNRVCLCYHTNKGRPIYCCRGWKAWILTDFKNFL